jgi:mRNA interferase RelE/StbE
MGRRLDALSHDPRPAGCERLSGIENLFRVRVGDYRIVYEIADDILVVLVIRIGHRSDVYRRL